MRSTTFTTICLLTGLLFLAGPSQAQVNVTFDSGGWGYRPGVTVSVGHGRANCGPNYRYQRRRFRRYNRGGGYYYPSNYPVANGGYYYNTYPAQGYQTYPVQTYRYNTRGRICR